MAGNTRGYIQKSFMTKPFLEMVAALLEGKRKGKMA
jgi:hypothetical protein